MLERAALLARFVAGRMGGTVPLAQVRKLPWVMGINDLKHGAGSNVVPLNKVQRWETKTKKRREEEK